ncbi:MAG: hypothetical protein R2735_14690 [Microthrixaceae bacterium]
MSAGMAYGAKWTARSGGASGPDESTDEALRADARSKPGFTSEPYFVGNGTGYEISLVEQMSHPPMSRLYVSPWKGWRRGDSSGWSSASASHRWDAVQSRLGGEDAKSANVASKVR